LRKTRRDERARWLFADGKSCANVVKTGRGIRTTKTRETKNITNTSCEAGGKFFKFAHAFVWFDGKPIATAAEFPVFFTRHAR
jgi:hypothetical protein